MQALTFAQASGMDMNDFLFEPLLEVNYFDITLPNLDIYDGIITTSNHAKKALPKDCHKDLSCYSVGDYAPTASELANKIINDNYGRNLRLLYIRGKDIAFDMSGALSDHHIDEIISYEAVASYNLSDEVIHAFKVKEINAVTFFSKRTAEIFVKLAREANILDNINDIKALCISDSMVECLYPIFGDNIEVSNHPNAREMAQMINSIKGVK